jgi:alpha-galactosidase
VKKLRLTACGVLCLLFGFLALLTRTEAQNTALGVTGPDISGTWVAKAKGPMGEMEIVYRLKVVDGKITGSQGLPFGDSPIVDGQVTGDSFRMTVAVERFGDIQNREITGKIVGDTLVLTPAMPGPPPAAAAGAGSSAGPGANPAAGPGPGPGGSGGPGGGRRFQIGEVVARRGTPTPSYRAPAVDYKTLPKVELPALDKVASNGLAKTPPMGWNSWNKFRTKIDDKTVRGIADAMVSSGMKDAGYKYVIIDDGWQGSRDANGVLAPNPNFPDMKALAAYVHSKGLLLGMYSSPGPRTCGGFEGSYGHEEQDARMYAEWGVDYLKYDWCSASRVWQDTDMQAAYQKMGSALEVATKAMRRPIVYALCQYGRAKVQTWGPEVGANLWRTTGDIRDSYDSMAKIGFAQTDLASYAGPGHWNDPDMLEIGNGGMTQDEYKTHFSLWAMIAAPLLSGNDLRSLTPEISQILLNKEVIAVDQDALGKGGTKLSGEGDVEIWTKPLASGDVAVAIFNRGTTEAKARLSWNNLDLRSKSPKVRDLWAHSDLGRFEDEMPVTVPPHGVVMLRVGK